KRATDPRRHAARSETTPEVKGAILSPHIGAVANNPIKSSTAVGGNNSDHFAPPRTSTRARLSETIRILVGKKSARMD
ncbi:hypothetical protein OFC58_40380, partial [Escherichia coli]|nr:hypothetical protein [Escherichia coli]